jgi:hypothetical protein
LSLPVSAVYRKTRGKERLKLSKGFRIIIMFNYDE